MLKAVFGPWCQPMAPHAIVPSHAVHRGGMPAKEIIGNKPYNSTQLWEWLRERSTSTVIPNRSNRNRRFSFIMASYRERHHTEDVLFRAKDF